MVVDTRTFGQGRSGVTWKVENAHDGRVECTEFNPFVPYWVASAGADGVVKVWDMRYQKHPAMLIDAHYGPVTSMSWSQTHCDIISTGSLDKSYRQWMLHSSISTPRKKPETFLVGSQIPISDRSEICIGAKMLTEYTADVGSPFVGVKSSKCKQNMTFGVTTFGQLYSFATKPELLEKVSPHKFDSMIHPEEYQIERAVFLRDISDALSKLISLSATSRATDNSIHPHESDLIALLIPRAPLDPQSWHIAIDTDKQGGREMIDRLEKDLEVYSYYLPPRFGVMKNWFTNILPRLKMEFETMTLRYNVLMDIANKRTDKILSEKELVFTALEADSRIFNSKNHIELATSFCLYDYNQCIEMSHRFVKIVSKSVYGNSKDVSFNCHTILYPTVYDTLLPYSKDNVNDSSISELSLEAKKRACVKWIETGMFADAVEWAQMANVPVMKLSPEEKKKRDCYMVCSDPAVSASMAELEMCAFLYLLADLIE